MELSQLVNFHSNKCRLERIIDNKKNIVPFVGAGISKGCGLYLWEELLDLLAAEYLTPGQIKALKAANNVFKYVDKIVAAAGNVEMVMKRIGEIFQETEVIHTDIPNLLVSAFAPMVITTNYDTLLEEASVCSTLGRIKALLPSHAGQMNEAIMLNARRLIKLHGSVEEISSMILTSKQYKFYYEKKAKRTSATLPVYLKKIFEGKKVLFVGCSLDKDYTLDILRDCVKRNQNISHFAILPCFANQYRQIERQKMLSKLGIEPIYYPEGDFEAVGQLLRYVASVC